MGVNVACKNDQQGSPGKSKDQLGICREQSQLPGAMLRAARVKKALKPEQVCKELGLTLSYLKALESDDYKMLRAPVYVRGYIRRYCDVLDISQGEVLDCYEASRQENSSNVKAPAANATDNRQQHLLNLGKPLLNKLKVSNWTFPLGLCALAVLMVVLVSATGSGRLVAAEVPLASDAHNNESGTLEINVFEQAWVEVIDARGDILAANLATAGTQLELSGSPPFQLKLDNADRVTVSYQQQPIHLIANSSDNTVLMTVGG